MGANKNSSPKRELGLYPKFTTTDSRTSLPSSCSHNGPTNNRNKPQTNPKRKHEARSKGLTCPAGALADSPRPWGGRSAITVQTVRDHRADGPRPTADCLLNTNRTTELAPRHADGPYHVLGRFVSHSCRADSPRRPSGRSAKHPPVKSNWPTGSKPKHSRTRDEHKEHLDELLHADSQRAPRGPSARHGNSRPNMKSKPPKLLVVHESPKRLKLLRKDLGKM
jgi:hypothetical protein